MVGYDLPGFVCVRQINDKEAGGDEVYLALRVTDGAEVAVDVRVGRGSSTVRASASGRDIYAITAPLLAEAVQRILDGRVHGCGTLAAGQAFDAGDFLAALAPAGLAVTFQHGVPQAAPV